MKVLLVLEELFETDGKNIASNSNWYIMALELLKHFTKGVLWVPIRKTSKINFANVINVQKIDNIEIVGRFPYSSFKKYYLGLIINFFSLHYSTNKLVKEADIIIIRGPTQLSKILLFYAKIYNKKIISIIAGDFEKTAYENIRNVFFERCIAKLVIPYIEANQRKLIKNSKVVFVYGDELFKKYNKLNKNMFVTQSALLSIEDFFFRSDTCLNDTIRLIRIGNYHKNKNYELIINVVNKLKSKGIKIELHCFGQILDVVYFNFLKSISSSEVFLNSQIKFGTKLFEEYKKSDIQIITSFSEGVPRTIIEGASFGVPLIAVNVGGIDSIVKNRVNGILLEKHSVELLSDAIINLINNKTLRQKIIRNGYILSKSKTRCVVINDIVKKIKCNYE